MNERDKYLCQLAGGLAYDWEQILRAASFWHPFRIRRFVRRFAGIHAATIAELAHVLQGGKKGKYWSNNPAKARDGIQRLIQEQKNATDKKLHP